jgi:hypothetical protein
MYDYRGTLKCADIYADAFIEVGKFYTDPEKYLFERECLYCIKGKSTILVIVKNLWHCIDGLQYSLLFDISERIVNVSVKNDCELNSVLRGCQEATQDDRDKFMNELNGNKAFFQNISSAVKNSGFHTIYGDLLNRIR